MQREIYVQVYGQWVELWEMEGCQLRGFLYIPVSQAKAIIPDLKDGWYDQSWRRQ
jgi:hypothetical protein